MGVQLAPQVQGFLLVVGGSNVQPHQPDLPLVALPGEDGGAEHRAVGLHRPVDHGLEPDPGVGAVADQPPRQILGVPAGHHHQNLAPFLQAGEHGVGEPPPLLFQKGGVVGLHGRLDQVVDDEDGGAEAGGGAPGGGGQVVIFLK